ncbi:MAG: cytochrome c3 family protein [Armatimonadota bacterium]|nr:cytochrome c3 family protein [Armatimonadota bacterium]MDR7402228.1 cytochrome c3 family protein [Armatimonadota bacterium]MDR7403356.1 cytochrome c3 family protein [Armatimonadota bacterium]MDR7436984.1 cytochrome c3 family protein [Armatimonadota bacterium]MDR7472242.1 cytochrome c3 family protein [Armatimonadota bacterium]
MSDARWVPLAVAVVLAAAGPVFSQDADVCLSCHGAEGLVLTLPGGETLPATVDRAVVDRSVHGGLGCASCHPAQTSYPHPPVTARTRRDFTARAAQVCATCHPDPAGQFDSSVHGRAQVLGLADAPTCVSCHGAHEVVRARTPEFRNNTPQLCGSCHARPEIMAKYGLRAVYETYISEFHGVTTTLYRITTPVSPSPAATCYDCHGVHDIRAADDPASRVHPSNILATCRTCHPQAGQYFATAWTEHRAPGPDAAPLVYYVQLFYRVLIPSVVGFLTVLTVLDLGRWAGDQLRRNRR